MTKKIGFVGLGDMGKPIASNLKNHAINHQLKNVTIINSCAVTEEAEKKVAYEIRKAKRNSCS